MWTALAFAVVGAIHLMPSAPVFVPETLPRLYGIAPIDSTLLVLMRHRALPLALVGILCLWSSWAPPVRPAALPAAAINVVGFLGFRSLRESRRRLAHRRRSDRVVAACLGGLDVVGAQLNLRLYCPSAS